MYSTARFWSMIVTYKKFFFWTVFLHCKRRGSVKARGVIGLLFSSYKAPLLKYIWKISSPSSFFLADDNHPTICLNVLVKSIRLIKSRYIQYRLSKFSSSLWIWYWTLVSWYSFDKELLNIYVFFGACTFNNFLSGESTRGKLKPRIPDWIFGVPKNTLYIA